MRNNARRNQGPKAPKIKGNAVPKRNGNHHRSNSNGRTTTTGSAGSPGHKK